MIRATCLVVLFSFLSACSGGDDDLGDFNFWDLWLGGKYPYPTITPTPTPKPGVVVLDTSEENYRVHLDTSTLSYYEYDSTLHFHRFQKESVVVLVEFAGTTEAMSASVNEIVPTGGYDIDFWVNNYFSDIITHHLYDITRHDIPAEHLSIDMVMFTGVETGRCGDEYYTYDVRYSIQPHEIIEGLQVPLLSETTQVWERYKDIDGASSCSPY